MKKKSHILQQWFIFTVNTSYESVAQHRSCRSLISWEGQDLVKNVNWILNGVGLWAVEPPCLQAVILSRNAKGQHIPLLINSVLPVILLFCIKRIQTAPALSSIVCPSFSSRFEPFHRKFQTPRIASHFPHQISPSAFPVLVKCSFL